MFFILQARLLWRMRGRFPSFTVHLVHFEHVLRALSQDETVYEKANSFYPERFLNPDGSLIDDQVEYAFGYGRRCVSFTRHILPFVTHYLTGSAPENIWLEMS